MTEYTQHNRAGYNSLDLRYLFKFLHRRIRFILGMSLLFGLFGILYLSFQVTQYTATAVIRINTDELQILELETAGLTRQEENAAIQSELDIIKSEPLILTTIKKLNLVEKPEFNASLKTPSVAAKTKSFIKDLIKGTKRKDNLSDTEKNDRIMARVLDEVLGRTSVRKDPLSYTVRISFTSHFPKRAQMVANAIADEYMLHQADEGIQASKDANMWLGQRVEELRLKVMESERAVQTFKERHNLFELDGKTLDDQQISELNSELVMSRTAYAQAQARLERAQQLYTDPDGIGSVKEVLDSSLIQNLREEETNLLRAQSDLSEQFGPKHPSMIRIHSELRDLRLKIDSEIKKIIKGLENEAEIARVRVNALSTQLGHMRGKMGRSTKLEVELAELEREAEANRALYESLLAETKKMGEAENLRQAKAKYIAKARLPLDPSAPNKKLILVLFLMLGGFVGTTVAMLLELYYNVRSTESLIQSPIKLVSTR